MTERLINLAYLVVAVGIVLGICVSTLLIALALA